MTIAANTLPTYPAAIQTLDAKRAYHLTLAALQESSEEHSRRTRKENPETVLTHYFNSEKQAELHQHRTAFANYLKSLDGQTTAVQKDAIEGIIHAWKDTMPNQLTTITSQLTKIVDQKWYGTHHEGKFVGVVEEIAYCAYTHKDMVAMQLLGSALSPAFRVGFGTATLEHVARKGYEQARNKTVRELKYLTAALRAA